MKKLNFPQALDRVLAPAGFTREKMLWSRTRGDIRDEVFLDRNWLDGSMMADLRMRDLVTEEILRGMPADPPLFLWPISIPAGFLLEKQKQWWRKDENGPEELAAAVQNFGLPWFDQVHTLEDEGAVWIRNSFPLGMHPASFSVRVVTLYRLGAIDEAIALLVAAKPRKMTPPGTVAAYHTVRNWFEAQIGRTLEDEEDPPVQSDGA